MKSIYIHISLLICLFTKFSLNAQCELFELGPKITICPGESIQLSPSNNGNCNFKAVWQGDGIFGNNSAWTTNYNHSVTEAQNGQGEIYFKLEANDTLPPGLLAYDHNAGDEFVHVDIPTGNLQSWLNNGGQDWVAMAYDETEHVLYGFSSISNTKKLYKYKMQKCGVQEIRDYTFDNLAFYAATFDPASNTLYAIGFDPIGTNPQELYTINTSTGIATSIGSLGLNTSLPFINPQYAQGDGINGLAWFPLTSTLYAVSENNNFYSIDPSTGAANFINTITPWNEIRGLTFDPSTNKLYGTDKNLFIYEINPANAAIINVTYSSPSPYNKVSALSYVYSEAFLPPHCTDTLQFDFASYTSDIIGDSIVCQGDSLILQLDIGNGIAPTNIVWEPSNEVTIINNSTALIYPSQSRTFYVRVDSGTCSFYDSIQVSLEIKPSANFNFTVNERDILLTNLSQDYDNLTWSFGDGQLSTTSEPNHSYSSEGEYIVTLTAINNNGCKDSLSKTVEITDELIFFLPNAFSPNNDGNNDFLKVHGRGFENFSLKIFNRWGQVVHKSEDPLSSWDGSFNGQDLNSEVYTYYIECTHKGNLYNFNGQVHLIR